jgi:hypothetical protein
VYLDAPRAGSTSVTSPSLANYPGTPTASSLLNAEPLDGKLALEGGVGFFAWVSDLVHTHRERLLAYAQRRRTVSIARTWCRSSRPAVAPSAYLEIRKRYFEPSVAYRLPLGRYEVLP